MTVLDMAPREPVDGLRAGALCAAAPPAPPLPVWGPRLLSVRRTPFSVGAAEGRACCCLVGGFGGRRLRRLRRGTCFAAAMAAGWLSRVGLGMSSSRSSSRCCWESEEREVDEDRDRELDRERDEERDRDEEGDWGDGGECGELGEGGEEGVAPVVDVGGGFEADGASAAAGVESAG